MTDKYECEQNSTGKKNGPPRKTASAAKAFRAATALVVFGLPMAVGACAVIGHAIHQAYKRIKSAD